MNKDNLWSLRLGFSLAQAQTIKAMGLDDFLDRSLNTSGKTDPPDFIRGRPGDIDEVIAYRTEFRKMSRSDKNEAIQARNKDFTSLRMWWLQRMRSEAYPLREKMCCFWHNHFVAATQKVRLVRWVYDHNTLCRQYAFGNFRELTREIVRTNAVITYLDNKDNRNNRLNENLSRELLELFTLGIGNYTETDIRQGAKALAGLTPGDGGGVYRPRWTYEGYVEYLGGRGKYKLDELIDRIFEHPESPYLVTRKIMQWFLYDEPKEEMVRYYGDYLRDQDFEVAPLLKKMFTEQAAEGTAGRKIKDPLVYILQLLYDLGFDPNDNRFVINFLRQQGMDLLNQPNVKGWSGGTQWLTTQIYTQRKQVANMLCAGLKRDPQTVKMGKRQFDRYLPELLWNKDSSADGIKADLIDRTLVETGEDLEEALNEIMPYDFDPYRKNAQATVGRVYNYLVTCPEFHLI